MEHSFVLGKGSEVKFLRDIKLASAGRIGGTLAWFEANLSVSLTPVALELQPCTVANPGFRGELGVLCKLRINFLTHCPLS